MQVPGECMQIAMCAPRPVPLRPDPEAPPPVHPGTATAGVFSAEVNALRSSSTTRTKLVKKMLYGLPVNFAAKAPVRRLSRAAGAKAQAAQTAAVAASYQ
jgi:hypothetical protein